LFVIAYSTVGLVESFELPCVVFFFFSGPTSKLGVGRNTLYRWIKAAQINLDAFRWGSGRVSSPYRSA
jgi:hypothetical protein